MTGVNRSNAPSKRERPEALDAGDTPHRRELGPNYLEQALPEHVKAALKAKASGLGSSTVGPAGPTTGPVTAPKATVKVVSLDPVATVAPAKDEMVSVGSQSQAART